MNFKLQNNLQIFMILSKFELQMLIKKNYDYLSINSSKNSKYFENQIIIYDLYFLNNNKYLKSFEDKSLSLRDFLKILNSNALKIFPIMMLRVFSIATCRKTYGKLSVVFLILSYKHKTFYNFLISKLLANFRVIDRFPTIRTTHKEPCIKFSSFFGHPKFFYRHFKKKFTKESKMSVFLNYNHIKKSIRSKTGFS
ncbi:hypothetical protein AGLY_013565 [Aphis glycines]|uniref:Uncharacterized protein n=1 Tax=Aphis glycines TaxID=307491 RepID=A0A6G0T6U9_APHGL|nr:hypothetical protein AGLY_013565 [Aphis glycines]